MVRNNFLNSIKVKVFLVLGLFLVLSFSGCSSSSNGSSNSFFDKNTIITNSNNGLKLDFVDGIPPSKVIKGEDIPFSFIFTNYQNHEISDLKLKTKGFDRTFISGISEYYSIPTISKSQNGNPTIYSDFIIENVVADGFKGNLFFNPVFDFCYTTKTKYQNQVCIPSIKNKCNEVIIAKPILNGPIGVKIEKINNIGRRIRIDFSLENKGDGKVVNSCFKRDDFANSFKIDKIELGKTKGKCKTDSQFTINDDKSLFYCEFTRFGDESYSSNLVLEFSYLYDEEKKVEILVEDLN